MVVFVNESNNIKDKTTEMNNSNSQGSADRQIKSACKPPLQAAMPSLRVHNTRHAQCRWQVAGQTYRKAFHQERTASGRDTRSLSVRRQMQHRCALEKLRRRLVQVRKEKSRGRSWRSKQAGKQ